MIKAIGNQIGWVFGRHIWFVAYVFYTFALFCYSAGVNFILTLTVKPILALFLAILPMEDLRLNACSKSYNLGFA